MITYNRSAFGLNLIFRFNGSAVYRGVIPGLLAVSISYAIRYGSDGANVPHEELGHPYAVGVVVSGITFLIVFRASQGYSRYWEAASCCYQMMSKWMDSVSHTAAYHMQSEHYHHIKPPSFYDYPELDAMFLTRDRERVRRHSEWRPEQQPPRSIARSINTVERTCKASSGKRKVKSVERKQPAKTNSKKNSAIHQQSSLDERTTPDFLTGPARLDGNWGALFAKHEYVATGRTTATFFDPMSKSLPRDLRGFASTAGGRTPPLFLQELAHLTSLMTAVALATLRNDVDGAESPLDSYDPGRPWPKVDPGDIPELYKNRWHRMWGTLLFFLGYGRTPQERTRYNALRPLPVIGGVSDAEIAFLQLARGPYAKTQLCWMWLSEFITREHLAGSFGHVGAPVISRVMQFLGDGMIFYNHGRKIMSIPFPFVHAQLSAFFVIVMIGLIPFLMDQYCEHVWCAAMLSFLSTSCLSGIHEVARELENPFRNVPNELPVVTMMAEFNEALLTMYAGYHPDFYWVAPIDESGNDNNSDDGDGSSDEVETRHPYLNYRECRRCHPPPAASGRRPGGAHIGATRQPQFAKHNDTKAAPVSISATYIISPSGKEHGEDSAPSEEDTTAESTKEESEVDQLRTIVLKQGEMMSKMMEEQARLNRWIESTLSKPPKSS